MLNIQNKNLLIAFFIIVLAILASSNYEKLTGRYFHTTQPYAIINGIIAGFVYTNDMTNIFSARLYFDLSQITNFKVIRDAGTFYQYIHDIPLSDLEIEDISSNPVPPVTPYAREIRINVLSPYFHAGNVWNLPVFYGQRTITVEIETIQSSQPYTATITYTLASGGIS